MVWYASASWYEHFLSSGYTTDNLIYYHSAWYMVSFKLYYLAIIMRYHWSHLLFPHTHHMANTDYYPLQTQAIGY